MARNVEKWCGVWNFTLHSITVKRFDIILHLKYVTA